jgi:spermidine synthase
LPPTFLQCAINRDCLAVLPALVAAGRIAVLGLGAGTIAHLVCAYYPDRVVDGWELDPAVIKVARQHMGMQQLEDEGSLVRTPQSSSP